MLLLTFYNLKKMFKKSKVRNLLQILDVSTQVHFPEELPILPKESTTS